MLKIVGIDEILDVYLFSNFKMHVMLYQRAGSNSPVSNS